MTYITRQNMSRLNDATPADWDKVRKAHPAIEKTPNSSLEDYKPYIDMAMKEAHHDVVNKPLHYNTGNIECIEAIEESMSSVAFKGYLKGNCLKYLWRYDYKGKQVEDLNKATWYLNKLTLVVTEENT